MNLKKRTIQLLQKIGLTPSEAHLYWIAHKSKNKTIPALQSESKLSKSSLYRAFEALKTKGLVTSDGKNWRQNVQVASLTKLRNLLVRKQIILKKIELQLKEVDDL